MSGEDYFWIAFMIAFVAFIGYCEYREREMRRYYKENPHVWRSSDWGP